MLNPKSQRASRITSLTSCPQCQQLLQQPHTLICGHNLCGNCIMQHATGGTPFFCFQCGSVLQHGQWIPNPLLGEMVAELLKYQKPGKEEKEGFYPASSGAAAAPQQPPVPVANPAAVTTSNPPNPNPAATGAMTSSSNPSRQIIRQVLDDYSERVKLNQNQRGYIRYIVIVDPDMNYKYTVGIKYVLNTRGAQELINQLEQNINAEYKKGICKQACAQIINGLPCSRGADCMFIHITPEGWNSRRRFTAAGDKRRDQQDAQDDTFEELPQLPQQIEQFSMEEQSPRVRQFADQAAHDQMVSSQRARHTPPVGSDNHGPRTIDSNLPPFMEHGMSYNSGSPPLGPFNGRSLINGLEIPCPIPLPDVAHDLPAAPMTCITPTITPFVAATPSFTKSAPNTPILNLKVDSL